ncbi:hypothetical protein Tco_1487510, partial [Tanacetum coccineum]
AEKLADAERERDELRAVNADQASHIKELEAELARKDSALVFSDRISNERAVENERLVSQLGHLLNNHEYKESLSIPFNLAIQAGWAKGLVVKRSEEDLMDTYPYVEKIFDLPRRTVQELLKMYPAPPPKDAPTKVNPSSQASSVSKAVPSKVITTATITASKVTPSVTHSDKNPDPSHPPGSSESAPTRG